LSFSDDPGARVGPPADAREMLALARAFLERKQIEESRLEAELLVAHALGLDRLGLYLALDRPVLQEEIELARELLRRRGRREPVAYLIGQREFYGRPFAVDPAVLIPRPETELLVDLARELARGRGPGLAIADLGTGSGCIAITLALEIEGAEVLGVDASAAALEVARHNAQALGADLHWREGEGEACLAEWVRERGRGFDLLLSNPPYVRPEERAALPPEVRDFEPPLSLFAPAGDPDHWVRRIAAAAPALLAPGGFALVELGLEQGPRALELGRATRLGARLERDLGGVERVLVLGPRP
jgi:release factor glutamine methyltransferase